MPAYFDPLDEAFWITIGVALLCGAIIGLERQLRGKPAGVRTSVLVCLGTAIFIHLGRAVDGEGADPTRVLGQLVTGIGFLGAGVMFRREGIVSGVTTAAVIWVLASIGATIGLGMHKAAVALALATVVILTGITGLEASIRHLGRGVHQSDEE